MMLKFSKSKKGFNQIDFAIGVSLVILMMSITISYITSTIVTPISTYSTSQLRTKAENLNSVVFKTKGVPKDWQWTNRSIRPSLGTTLFTRKIHLDEYNGTGNIDKNVRIHLNLHENAYVNSIVAYEENESLPLDIVNTTDFDGDDFLENADLILNVNVSSNSEKTLNLYYSRDNSTQKNYTDLTPENHTLNIMVFSERKTRSVSRQKMNKMQEMSYGEVRDKFAMERNFYMKIRNETTTIWKFGRKENQTSYSGIPDGGNVILFTDNMLYQRKDARIDYVEATTAVW